MSYDYWFFHQKKWWKFVFFYFDFYYLEFYYKKFIKKISNRSALIKYVCTFFETFDFYNEKKNIEKITSKLSSDVTMIDFFFPFISKKSINSKISIIFPLCLYSVYWTEFGENNSIYFMILLFSLSLSLYLIYDICMTN